MTLGLYLEPLKSRKSYKSRKVTSLDANIYRPKVANSVRSAGSATLATSNFVFLT